jgi:hypothetical protein
LNRLEKLIFVQQLGKVYVNTVLARFLLIAYFDVLHETTAASAKLVNDITVAKEPHYKPSDRIKVRLCQNSSRHMPPLLLER